MHGLLRYERILLDEYDELLVTDRPIVLFGTLTMGMIAKKTLDYLNIKITCFCDNDKSRQGVEIEGTIVLSPEEVKQYYPSAKIYICSFKSASVNSIKKQFEDMNFQDIHGNDMLFYIYQLNIMKRNIPSSDLASLLNILSNESEKNILPIATVAITDKCTLKCKDCAALVPYFTNPKHYSKEVIIKTIENLSKSVNAIEAVGLFGGEPLLHPDLVEICDEISKIKNIARLHIITNGTILPTDKVLADLKDKVTHIVISDYGRLSMKKEILKAKAKEHGVFIESRENEGERWIYGGELKANHRTKIENDALFRKCNRKDTCNIIMNGEYHLCSHSASGMMIGAIPKNPNDYVNLIDCTLSPEEIQNQIKILCSRKESITACAYCEYPLFKHIPAAIQTDKILYF